MTTEGISDDPGLLRGFHCKVLAAVDCKHLAKVLVFSDGLFCGIIREIQNFVQHTLLFVVCTEDDPQHVFFSALGRGDKEVESEDVWKVFLVSLKEQLVVSGSQAARW